MNAAKSIRRPVWILVSVTAVVLLVVVATLSYEVLRGRFDVSPDPPSAIATADLSGIGPGSLVSAFTIPSVNLTGDFPAAKILYRSTEGDTGLPTEVSGTVFVPSGAAPEGGWPIVALGHGTTGIDQSCAPSMSGDLSGLAPVVSSLLESGYAVTVPDYQGLGAPGIHPYLDARTAGFNVIDSVRALRATFPNVSSRWAAAGWSQGGAAVWAADEYSTSYAPELELVGALALAPPADVTGIVGRARTGSLTAAQVLPYVWLLTSLQRLHPNVDLDDFRRGLVALHWDELSACVPQADVVNAIAKDGQTDDLSPIDDAAAAQLTEFLRQWALPQRPLAAPLFVLYGSDDPYVDPQWTTAAIKRACDLRGPVVFDLQQGKGHEDLDFGDQAQWLADRFAKKPVLNGCPT